VKVLLDTCVLSELQKQVGSPVVQSFFASSAAKNLFLSVITIGEIAKGVALLPDGDKKRSLRAWLIGLSSEYEDRILPLDQDTAEIWGELSARGQQRGTSIPVADGLIAATALRHGLHVATRNTSHFEAAGAMVINPWVIPKAAAQ
jgi:predicted nucleic acid-binding protein